MEPLFDANIVSEIFDEVDDAIFIVSPDDGRILHVNRKACAALGYTYDELTGLRVFDVQTGLVTEDDWRQWFAAIAPGQSYNFVGHHRRKDGNTFPVEIHGRHFTHLGGQYFVSIARDISSWRRLEGRLCRERNKLEAVISALGDGLTMQDTDFRILYQNEIHEKKQGRHRGEYCYRAYHGLEQVCEGCLLALAFKDGRTHRREASARSQDGSTIHFEVAASPVRDEKGDIVAGIETVRDITQQKELQEQFLQAQKMEAVGRLTNGIAHDFNNLLAVINGYSEIALVDIKEDNTPLHKNIQAIHEAGVRAASLTKHLLAFSRREKSDVQVFDLNVFMPEISNMLRRMIGGEVELVLKLNAAKSLVAMDETHLTQIIMNLAVNARDAIGEREGTFTITVDNYVLDKEGADGKNLAPGDYVMIEAADTGCGIREDTRAKIFEPFFTTKEQGRGTGLGLSTVYGLVVNNYNGWITVNSAPGAGCTFTILLPQADETVSVQ